VCVCRTGVCSVCHIAVILTLCMQSCICLLLADEGNGDVSSASGILPSALLALLRAVCFCVGLGTTIHVCGVLATVVIYLTLRGVPQLLPTVALRRQG
jgi:hypothetical protein